MHHLRLFVFTSQSLGFSLKTNCWSYTPACWSASWNTSRDLLTRIHSPWKKLPDEFQNYYHEPNQYPQKKQSNTWTPWRIKDFSTTTCPASILPAWTSLQWGYEKEVLKLTVEQQCCPYRESGSLTSLSDGQTSTTQQTLGFQALNGCKRGLGDWLAALPCVWKISYIRLRSLAEGANKVFQKLSDVPCWP